jgi:outer membrane protein assembly factor BamB
MPQHTTGWGNWSQGHTPIGLSHTRGVEKYHTTTRFSGYAFVSHPSYCAATGHLFLGSEEAEIYAATPRLSRMWNWPDVAMEESLKYVEWGAGAVKDSLYYVSHADDSIFCFYDSGAGVVRRAAFTPGAGLVDAPVIDADGNVLFVTDSGDLFKIGPGLDTTIWRVRPGGSARGPVIGVGGTIYMGSNSPSFHAVGQDGSLRWSVELDGACRRPAVGRTAVFAGTAAGTVYALDPANGTVIWSQRLGSGFLVSPLVAAGGHVYFQDTSDVVHCLRQADGGVVWECDCRRMLPAADAGSSPRRRLSINYYPPNPTLASNGDVIVAGERALFCVTGYPEGPLDPFAPWPKWQHDLYNTGYVGGGR